MSGIQTRDDTPSMEDQFGSASPDVQAEELIEALKPFAADAENWADMVPDDYAPRCTEPGAEYAHPGSEAAFTVGDIRRAASLLTRRATLAPIADGGAVAVRPEGDEGQCSEWPSCACGRGGPDLCTHPAPAPDPAGEAMPKPSRKDGGEPCGECHIQPGETCDICGAINRVPAGDVGDLIERRDVANAINRARYGGYPGGLPPRDIEFEDEQSREYAYRLADAACAIFASALAAYQARLDATETNRLAWERSARRGWSEAAEAKVAADLASCEQAGLNEARASLERLERAEASDRTIVDEIAKAKARALAKEMRASPMAKLTKAQIAVLTRMADGDEVWTTSGRRPSAFWNNHLGQRAPSFATLHAMYKAGMIEEYERDFTGGKYRITEAGRRDLSVEGNP